MGPVEAAKACELLRAPRVLPMHWGTFPVLVGTPDALRRELKERGVAPPCTDRFLEALPIMNEAAHGVDVDPNAVAQAISVGTTFLAELSGSA